MPAALTHLHASAQGHTELDTPLQVLEALQAAAARGAARPVCALAAASFRAATLLGMTCAEAARLGPRASLQIMLMKGPQAAPVREAPPVVSAMVCRQLRPFSPARQRCPHEAKLRCTAARLMFCGRIV